MSETPLCKGVKGAGPQGLARALHLLSALETGVAAICLLVMTAVVFADVIGREIIGAGLSGAQQIGVYAFIYAGFLGLPLATASGEHLRPHLADFVLNDRLPHVLPHVLPRIQHGLAAVLSFGLAAAGLSFARDGWRLGELSPVLDIPVWMVQAVLPYAFLSSGLRHLAFAAYPGLAPAEAGDAL